MLTGIELIDCAKANAQKGITVAAKQSGYDDNVNLFLENLQQACQSIGVNIEQLEDLVTDQQLLKENKKGLEISPDSPTQL